MATDIVQSLFGPSPYDIQRAQRAEMDNTAWGYAQAAPFEAARAGLFSAAGGLAGAGAEALGMVNPQVEQARVTEQAMAGIDPSNPDSIMQRAQQVQDPRLKMRLTQYGQQMKAQQQEAAYKKAMETKSLATAEKESALADKALRDANMKEVEVGVKGKPDYRQRALYNPTTGAIQPIGEPYQIAAGVRVSMGGAGSGESKQPLAYVDPATGQAVWGTIGDARGKSAAMYDPTTKQIIATGQSRGKELGEAAGAADVALAGSGDMTSMVKSHIKELLSHPGFESTVGATLAPGARFVPGTDEAGFSNRLDQIKGGAFLEAYKVLKGGGQITEVEGKKATEAINRMNISTDEAEFKAAAKDFTDAVDVGVKKLKAQSKLASPKLDKGKELDALPPPSQLTGKTVRDTVTGIRYKSDGNKWVKQ